ncbi:MAG: hypothetical protein H6722_03595 [Sandaracinus sp.]|nr:hypothetical protein [Sandaracinus sp.]
MLGLRRSGQPGPQWRRHGRRVQPPSRLRPELDGGDLTGATDLAVGGYWHACALVAGGRVRCWGQNASGELGNRRLHRARRMPRRAWDGTRCRA